MHKLALVAALCLSFSALPPASAIFCSMNVHRDLGKNQPLLLQENSNEFVYPRRARSKDVRVGFCENIRIACPQSSVKVLWSTLQVSEATLKCYGLNFFDVVGTGYAAPFRRIGCAQPAVAVANGTDEVCMTDATRARIGFQLSDDVHVPTIDEICHDEALARTHWAHSKVSASVRNAQRPSAGTPPAYKSGEFYQNVAINASVFTRSYQRKRFAALFGSDAATVDKYVPAAGDNYLVEGQLVPRADMFYKPQQASTYFYINTVPVWKSIRDKNWRLVEDIVRKTAGKYSANLDVWTGGLEDLALNDASGTATNLTLLTNDENAPVVPVPKHLFKYVLDRSRNRAIVYVTLNNPHATTISAEDTICKADARCLNLYPQFNIASMGYTYCCTVDSTSEFFNVAQSLELPTFANAQILI